MELSQQELVAFLIAILTINRVHEVGDYWVQESWMAWNKGKRVLPALVHSLAYYFCFSLWFHSLESIGFPEASIPIWIARFGLVGVTHYLIDHFQLPALYAFWLNRRMKDLFPNGQSCQEWKNALRERRWIELPPPCPKFVIRELDQSWHRTCNAIALILSLVGG